MITPDTKSAALDAYNRLAQAVKPEIQRLGPKKSGESMEHKPRAIQDAMERIRQAIFIQFSLSEEEMKQVERFSVITPKLNAVEVSRANLSSVQSILKLSLVHWENATDDYVQGDIEIRGNDAGFFSSISLRRALNIARNNPFQIIDENMGPLWGKSRALTNVEARLGLQAAK